MRSFVKLPLPILYSTDLSFGAKIAYSAIIRRAWLAGRQEETDGVALPPLDVIAEDINVSRTAFKRYLGELRSHSVVVTRRSAGLVYYVFDDSATPEQLAAIGPKSAHRRTAQRADSGPLQRADSGPLSPGVLISLRKSKSIEEDQNPSGGSVDPDRPTLPGVVLVEGRNLALDALCEVCGIDSESPRVRQAAAALNSKSGIRHLFWRECERAVERHPEIADRLHELVEDPAKFEEMLADRVRTKVAALRLAEPWRTSLSPHLIRDHWLDVENRLTSTGRVTDADIDAAFGDLDD